jgi:hypothetical protein
LAIKETVNRWQYETGGIGSAVFSYLFAAKKVRQENYTLNLERLKKKKLCLKSK